jgi:hypothetical protein
MENMIISSIPESQNSNAKSEITVSRIRGATKSHIPTDDLKTLAKVYQITPNQVLGSSTVDFLWKIDRRIQTEWVMNPEERGPDSFSDYQGQAYDQFIDAEVHYELARSRSAEDRGTHEGYQRARDRVLGGLVNRAIELFSEWGGIIPDRVDGKYKDTKNLREDLSPYIPTSVTKAA